MPKTNHSRDFVDERDYTVPPGDWTNGKHGAARNKRGAKKYIISRKRFAENQETKKVLKTSDSVE